MNMHPRFLGYHINVQEPMRICTHCFFIHLFELEQTGTNLKDYVDSFPKGQPLILSENRQFPYRELSYQWKKYRFLKRSNFFRTPRNINLNSRLNTSRVATDLTRVQQVIFETTEACNLSCTYCTYSKFYVNRERGTRNFDTAGAKRALEHLLSIRARDAGELIVSFYGGEPLLNIRFIKEIVAFLSGPAGAGHQFKFSMTSNGLLLSKHADFLAAGNFEISVSLDGDEYGNSFRVLPNKRSSHETVVKNLDFVRDHYPGYFEKNVTFLAVLHNKNSFTGVNEYIKGRYGKTPLTSMISTMNIPDEHRHEFSSTFLRGMQPDFMERKAMHELFMAHPTVKELANAIEKYTGIVFKNLFQVMTRVNGDEGSREFLPTATCMPFSMRVFFTAEGAILPCEHIGRSFELGSLSNEEIRISTESIAGMFNQCFDKIRSLCDRCFLADNCKECVFNTRIETDQPECDFFLDEKKFKTFLARYFTMIENDFPLYTRLLKEEFHGR